MKSHSLIKILLLVEFVTDHYNRLSHLIHQLLVLHIVQRFDLREGWERDCSFCWDVQNLILNHPEGHKGTALGQMFLQISRWVVYRFIQH